MPSFTLYAGAAAAPVATRYVNSTFVFYTAITGADGVELEFTEDGIGRGWATAAQAGVYQLASATEGDHVVSVRVRDLA